MKRLCLLSICLFGFYWMLLAQEHPAEAEYRQQDSLLQEWWNRRQEESYRYLEQHPDQLDSIRERTDEDLRELLRQTIALATRYASTSGGMERLFAVRQYVPERHADPHPALRQSGNAGFFPWENLKSLRGNPANPTGRHAFPLSLYTDGR